VPGTNVLDTALGLGFTVFLMAVLCSAVVESIASLVKQRAKYLLRGLDGTLCEQAPDPTETKKCVSQELDDLGAQGLLVGWDVAKPADTSGLFSRILGPAITAAAASLGAPFWFDVLNRLGSLRNVGNKPKSDAS
jgi:hypothetical protein